MAHVVFREDRERIPGVVIRAEGGIQRRHVDVQHRAKMCQIVGWRRDRPGPAQFETESRVRGFEMDTPRLGADG